jgi:Flp pilus assembly protein TadG
MRSERGQSVVEFALVLPVLLIVVVGILTFGRIMNYSEQATHLANEAVRYVAVNDPPTTTGTLGQWVRSQITSNELQNGGGAIQGPPTVCLSFPNGTSNPGDPVEVEMSFKFNWLHFSLGKIFKVDTITTTVTENATMRIEASPTSPFFAAGCS